MTYEEAKALKNALENPATDENGIILMSPQFRDVIIPYIEKQIPKRPAIVKKDWGEFQSVEVCPNCRRAVCWPQHYCGTCGQALLLE